MSTPDLNPSPETLTLADLKPESDLLHLLFHRNKNQHHCSKWWKWLGMLQRNIKKLLDPANAAAVEARLVYMRRVIIPSCYTAFTSVVANSQFAPLGLALLATLARVYKIVRAEKKAEVEEKEEVLEAVVMVEEAWGERVVKKDGLVIGPVTMEDFGEALKREEVMEEDEIMNEEIPEEKEEMVMIEKELVMERKEKEQLIQETTTSEALLKVKAEEKTTGSGEENAGELLKERKKRDGKVVKKKAMKLTSQSPLPPLRLPSPTREETPKRKIKRKTDDKEGAKKKKKRKKGDEIDDLFAGLL